MLKSLKQSRIFSEPLKRKVVKDIEGGKASVLAVSREYQISPQTVYNWLNKYSRHLQSNQKLVLQMDSEAYKTKELENRIKELEAALGRKQLEVEFLDQLIAHGKKELGVDLKKKFSTPPFTGSGSTNHGADTK